MRQAIPNQASIAKGLFHLKMLKPNLEIFLSICWACTWVVCLNNTVSYGPVSNASESRIQRGNLEEQLTLLKKNSFATCKHLLLPRNGHLSANNTSCPPTINSRTLTQKNESLIHYRSQEGGAGGYSPPSTPLACQPKCRIRKIPRL